MKTSVITGVTGQDGAYLARQLLERGQKVYGAYRRTSSVNFWRLEELGILDHADFHAGRIRSDRPGRLHAVTGKGRTGLRLQFGGAKFRRRVLRAADIHRANDRCRRRCSCSRLSGRSTSKIKFYQASTSELYGRVHAVPQNEDTPFHPRSPYAVAKLFAHWMTVNYREAYGMFASSGILFNHELPLRGREFVTRKITNCRGAHPSRQARLLEIGNLEARRDWGFAKEYTSGMILIMDYSEPETFVLATGKNASVRRVYRNGICRDRSSSRLARTRGRRRQASARKPVRSWSRSIRLFSALPRSTS